MIRSIPPFRARAAYEDRQYRELYARVHEVEAAVGIAPGPPGLPGVSPNLGRISFDKTVPLKFANAFVPYNAVADNVILFANLVLISPTIIAVLQPPAIVLNIWAHIHVGYAGIDPVTGNFINVNNLEQRLQVGKAEFGLGFFARSPGVVDGITSNRKRSPGENIPLLFSGVPIADDDPNDVGAGGNTLQENRGRLLTQETTVVAGHELRGSGVFSDWPLGMVGSLHVKMAYVDQLSVDVTRQLSDVFTTTILSPVSPNVS